MNEMINATTSLLPLLTVEDSPSLYYKASVITFCFIATINHIFPENLEGVTHLVKLLVSNILFSLINLDPSIGVAISLIDLSPLFFKNKKLISAGELLIQVPRQLIDIYLVLFKILDITGEQKYIGRVLFILLCKAVYFLERRLRIKRKERSNFYFFHCSEHLGMYVLLCSVIDCSMYNIVGFIKIFLCFIVCWCVLFYFINLYLYMNFLERVPYYIKKDEQMMEVLKRKLEKNLFNGKLYNYICKPWTIHLKLEFITWGKIEEVCEEIVEKMRNKSSNSNSNSNDSNGSSDNKVTPSNNENISNSDSMNNNNNNIGEIEDFDYIIGIATGGVFVAACLGKLLNLSLIHI
jgi:hypothetical protein